MQLLNTTRTVPPFERSGTDLPAQYDTPIIPLSPLSPTNTPPPQEFVKYLVFAFCRDQDIASTSSKSLAGIVLKNNINKIIDAQTLGYVLEESVINLSSKDKLVRHITANLCAKIAKQLASFGNLHEFVLFLERSVRNYNVDPTLADGAVLTLLFIAEDSPELLNQDENGRAIARLIPLWIEMCGHPEKLFKQRALDSIACFSSIWPQVLELNCDGFLIQLAALQNDPDPAIRKRVLQALANIVSHMPQGVTPDLFTSMAGFALRSMALGLDEDVAREACEFFDAALSARSQVIVYLNPMLPTLLPLLIMRMTYTPEDLFHLQDQIRDDAHIPDRFDEIRPGVHHDASNRLFQFAATPEDAVASADTSSDNDSDDDQEHHHHHQELWTTRRTACTVLEAIAKLQNPVDPFMQLFLSTISGKLTAKSWMERESALMALGALGAVDQCAIALEPHLNQLLPFLVAQGQASEPTLIRKCTVWTLGRFAGKLASLPDSTSFQPCLFVLLERVMDANKQVQFASLGALAELFEKCDDTNKLTLPLVQICIQTFTKAMDSLQTNNQYYLFDSFASLFRSRPANEFLSLPELTSKYMPRIWHRFENATPADLSLGSLAWFFAQVCHTLGPAYFPFIDPTLKKCSDFMEEGISIHESALEVGETLGDGDLEFVACSLQLISSMVSAVQGDFPRSVNAGRAIELAFRCVQQVDDPDVRRDALGLLGDVVMLAPMVFIADPRVGANLWSVAMTVAEDEDSVRTATDVTKNAIWVLAELASHLELFLSLEQFARAVRLAFGYMLLRENNNEFAYDLEHQCAYLAARLMILNSDGFLQAFENVGSRSDHPNVAFRFWCKVIFKMQEDDSGRDVAVAGWVEFVNRSIGKYGVPCAPIVLSVMAKLDFRDENPGLHSAIKQMLQNLKAAHATEQEWMKKINVLPGTAGKARLGEIYG